MRKPISWLTTSLLVLLVSASASAQQKATLDQVEAAIKGGQTEQARATLERWKKEHASISAISDEGVRATYLAARLTPDAGDAEDLYLSIAISAPAANKYVPESLLRVGQAELQSGSPGNAIPYFKRLLDNYPKSEFAPTASAWLKRAQSADTTRAIARQPAQPSTPAPARAESGGRYAVQVAAFREKGGARSVMRALEKAGFTGVRVVTVPDNSLLRVRIGRFNDARAAGDVLSKLKSAGYQAVVVSDATRESVVRD